MKAKGSHSRLPFFCWRSAPFGGSMPDQMMKKSFSFIVLSFFGSVAI
jgi:hypothetical protein